MTTKVEYLSTLRTPTSFVVHVDCLHTVDKFFKWVHPRTANGPPHVTQLYVAGPTPQLAFAGYGIIVTFLETYGAVIRSRYAPTWCFPPVNRAEGNERRRRMSPSGAELQRHNVRSASEKKSGWIRRVKVSGSLDS